MASLVGLAALAVSACSNDGASETGVAATEPADGGATAPPKTSAPDAGEHDDAEPKTCMDAKPFDATKVAYRPPAVKAGSCTTADIATFDDYLRDHPQASVEELTSAMTKQSKSCSACIFGKSDDASWAAIVSDGTSASLNAGGCVSVVSGEDDCGRAYQQWNTCINHVCAACSGDERTQCNKDAQQAAGPCGTASKALFGACGTNVNDYIQECFGAGMGTVVAKLCGPAAKDGGS
ncbi:MAG: hypothetical protein KF819_06210 [Labilithrix sp.]|nr:hypothetical protein [Labilithrix sp.]